MGTTYSTRRGLPAPDGSDPISNGDDQMRALRDALDWDVSYDEGPLSSRPTSTAGTPGIAGRMYRVTDRNSPNGVIYQDIGVGLVQLWPGDNDLLPWTIDINPFLTPATQTNWSTIAPGGQVGGGELQSSGAQNAQIGWDVALAAGTWTFTLLYSKGPNRGIYTVALDGTTLGMIDGLAGSATDNVLATIPNIAVAAAGKKRLTLTMATKNASSGAYYGYLQALGLRRTA